MLPKRALTDIDIATFGAKYLQHFRGVFMRNNLPRTNPWKRECGIINLDDATGSGTHWVAYYKNLNDIKYFDSFGNLQPPVEVVKYLGDKLSYNYNSFQKFNSYNCGHLCLSFLSKTSFYKK